MMNAPKNAVCGNCTLKLVAIAYRRAPWFRLLREPLKLGMRWLSLLHHVNTGEYLVRTPACYNCIRFYKVALKNRQLPPRYSVKTESQALSAALDGLGLSRAVDIVAWSYGALVTLDYALNNPSRVRSLTLIEPPALWVLHKLGELDDEAKQNEEVLRTLHGDISEEQLEQFLCAVGFCPPGQDLSAFICGSGSSLVH